MMIPGCPLTFLRQVNLCVLIHLYGENIEKLFSQNVLKIKGGNLQCKIEVANPFSYNQNFVPQGYLSLLWAIIMYKIV